MRFATTGAQTDRPTDQLTKDASGFIICPVLCYGKGHIINSDVSLTYSTRRMIYLAKIFNIKQVTGFKKMIVRHLEHGPACLQKDSYVLQTEELLNRHTTAISTVLSCLLTNAPNR